MSRTKWVLIAIVILLLLAGIVVGVIFLVKSGDSAEKFKIELISSFVEGGAIPANYTCDGEDVSPALAWSGVPNETKSLALIVEDPDAPGKTFYHWAIYNIPSVLTGLAEGVEQVETVPGVGVQGKNSFDEPGYSGPCPPQGSQHHYSFTLYALDQPLDLQPGVTAGDVQKAMEGHILEKGQLTGVYSR